MYKRGEDGGGGVSVLMHGVFKDGVAGVWAEDGGEGFEPVVF